MYLVNIEILSNLVGYYFNSILRIFIFCYLLYLVFPIHNVDSNSFIIGIVWLFYWIPSLLATRKFFKNEINFDPDPFASALYDDAQLLKLNEENKKLMKHDIIVQSFSIVVIMIFASTIYDFLTEIDFLNRNMVEVMTLVFKEKIVIHLVALIGLYVTVDSYRAIFFNKDF